MMMDNGISDAENERKIANAGGISEFHLKVVMGVSFSFAVLAVFGRMVVRVYTRRRLFLDDAFLGFGLGCLCTATILSYRMVRTMFLAEALQRYSDIVIPADQAQLLLSNMAIGVAIFCLTWTTLFAVKFSFLMLFWHLIQRTSKWLIRYYWAVVGTCVISWLFIICEPFMLCHYFGPSAAKCSSKAPNRLNVALTSLVNILDIITDIMIVSIPIIILGRTQLRTSQKVSLGALLCLSVVMIAIACARFSGLRNIATVWIYLWHYIDACVACIMASLLTFRTLFVSGRTRVFKQQELKGQLPSIKQQELKGRLPSIKQRVLHNMKILNMAAWEMVEDEMEELPEVPSATPSGLRNFISRYHRSPGSTTAMNSEGDRTKYDC